jgi:serine protease
VQVINLSLGAPGEAPVLNDAIRYAVSRGAFVAIAAGNSYEDGNPLEYPAGYAPSIDGAMAVGATGRSNRRAYYSNSGAQVEITAPGGDVRDGGLAGVIYQTSLFAPDFDPFTVTRPRFDRYADTPNQGTSMASPHVAGVAALLYSQGINRPNAIEAAIKRFAVDLGPAGRDNDFGYGLVDARASLRGLGVAR